jgi:hypothetical protein
MKRTTVSVDSLRLVIERHNLKPNGDNKYRITGDMIAEAITLDAIDDSGSPQRTVKGPEDA